MNQSQKILTIVATILVLGGATWALYAISSGTGVPAQAERAITRSSTNNSEVPTDSNSTTSQPVDATNTTVELLLYLVEEEKLAHDIYTKMYELYGANVFGTILGSETNHQSQVLALLTARGIADPRSSLVGVFANTRLQTLYDTLLAQGKQGVDEAYKVGVAIEELDIADISKQLETASDTDVIDTLERLRRGSENHLRAFNRQLAR